MMSCCLWSLCFYRLWLSVLYHSWGLFIFIEPPHPISPAGLVSWLRNWSVSGDSGRSLSLHQFWMTALLDKGSLAACSSQSFENTLPTIPGLPGLCRQVWHYSDIFPSVCKDFLPRGHFRYCILGSNICRVHYDVTWCTPVLIDLGRGLLCLLDTNACFPC